jgi:hypothetical protein
MPWKVKNLVHNTEASRLHLHDAKVDVHMVTHLKTGVVDLFMGADHPANARVWVSIDAERPDLVQVERLHHVNQGHYTVIVGILGTMALDPLPVAVQIKRELDLQKASRNKAWPEYVVDESHLNQAAE